MSASDCWRLVTVSAGTAVDDHGSIVVMRGVDDAGHTLTFGVDHRHASAILEHLEHDSELLLELEAWQILGASA